MFNRRDWRRTEFWKMRKRTEKKKNKNKKKLDEVKIINSLAF